MNFHSGLNLLAPWETQNLAPILVFWFLFWLLFLLL